MHTSIPHTTDVGNVELTSLRQLSYLYQLSLDSIVNIKNVVAKQPLPIFALIRNGWLDRNVPPLLSTKAYVSTQAPNGASRAVGTHHGPTRIHLADYSLRHRRNGNSSPHLPPALVLSDDCGPPGAVGGWAPPNNECHVGWNDTPRP